MHSQTAETAGKLSALDALAANYGAELNPNLKRLWLDLLSGYSSGQVSEAVKSVIERYEYKTLPPFAVLKKALYAQSGISPEALEAQAIAEWGIVFSATQSNGRYNKPSFHPTTEYALQLMGGWGSACSWNMEDIAWRRKEFIAFWKEAHGKVEYMTLGAEAVREALASGSDRTAGPVPIGAVMARLTAGNMAQ